MEEKVFIFQDGTILFAKKEDIITSPEMNFFKVKGKSYEKSMVFKAFASLDEYYNAYPTRRPTSPPAFIPVESKPITAEQHDQAMKKILLALYEKILAIEAAGGDASGPRSVYQSMKRKKQMNLETSKS